MSRASTHFVSAKAAALDVASGLRVSADGRAAAALPLVAVGGWDNRVNHVSLHAPTPLDDLRGCELAAVAQAEHDGDVAALRFVRVDGGERLLVSASSAGGLRAFRVQEDGGAMLARVELPHWAKVFGDFGATSLDVSDSGGAAVSASTGGALAWISLDESMNISTIENKDTSRLPLHAVKLLGRDTVAATVGAAPGSQLRIWDIAANNQFPVTVCSDAKTNAVLTSIETHPTRPELLFTGSDDGRVSVWDRRRLDAPFRSEAKHSRAVRSIKLHNGSPRYLFSASDDGLVKCWDFHYGRRDNDPVEYERRSLSVASVQNGFGKRFDGLEVDGLAVKHVAHGPLPWSALAIHAASDTLVVGSDAQSLVIVQGASKVMVDV